MAAVLDRRAGERHRPVGAAVEAAAEGDDPRPPRGVLGQLDRRLDRLRPGVREEEPGLLPVPQAGEGARQALVQLQPGLVVEDVLLGVDDLAGLLGDRGRDARVGVTGVRDPDPAGVVEVALAVDRLDPGADAALHHEVGVARPDRRRRRRAARASRAARRPARRSCRRQPTSSGRPPAPRSADRPRCRWPQSWTPMNGEARSGR